jgi:protein-tyrosine phosphatase
MLNFILRILEITGISKESDLIIPNIYLGNYNSSQNLEFLKNNNIKLIINCSKDLNFIDNYQCHKIRIPIDDNRIFKNYDLLDHINILEIIQEYRNKNENILIHCRFGAQRSANIILLYLIKTLKIDTDISYDLIKQKRPLCFFPINSFNHILNF